MNTGALLQDNKSRRQERTLTPRAYKARLDLCHLWDLVCMRKTQAEIAEEMGKDPAWVSRSIKRLNADFASEFTRPEEARLITENIARFESLYVKAIKTAEVASGHARIAALRLATEIARQEADYQVVVGYVGNRRSHPAEQKCPRCQLVDELTAEDIETIYLDVMEVNAVSTPIPALAESSG